MNKTEYIVKPNVLGELKSEVQYQIKKKKTLFMRNINLFESTETRTFVTLQNMYI